MGVGSNPTSNTIEPLKYCIDCGKELIDRKTRCRSCSSKMSQPSKAPPREELKELIRTKPFIKIGEMFGVSDNAVRKWCKNVGLPSRTTDIKSISDEEWDLL